MRALLAQETGLVLVIVLLCAGLFAYTKVNADPVVRVDRSTGERVEYNKFLNPDNIIGIATNASFIAVLALGTMGIIIMGGIDLSIGSVYALAAVVGALAMKALQSQWLGVQSGQEIPTAGGAPVWAALPVLVLVCGGVGALCGAVNGAGTVGLGVHPFIITLGGMAAYRGVAFVLTGGQTESTVPESVIGGFFRLKAGGLELVPMLFMVAAALLMMFTLSRTVFGRRTYAIGGNETAARYAGVPVGVTKIWLFVIGGAAAGVSAAMMVGFYGSASSSAGPAYELKAIAAAVVGGVSLAGGRGTALGVLLGALVIQIIENAIVMVNLDSNYTNIVIGVAIVLAVVVDQAKARLTGPSR